MCPPSNFRLEGRNLQFSNFILLLTGYMRAKENTVHQLDKSDYDLFFLTISLRASFNHRKTPILMALPSENCIYSIYISLKLEERLLG